uniref:N-acetyltransferase domain-containing protein n=1 Tax=Corethron hystrix TaxID=216773 RepID=A0A7S1G1E2_9STRA
MNEHSIPSNALKTKNVTSCPLYPKKKRPHCPDNQSLGCLTNRRSHLAIEVTKKLKKVQTNYAAFSAMITDGATNTILTTVRPKTQMYLDFGQKSFGKNTTCEKCGMLYMNGMEEDEATHRKVCQSYLHGVPFRSKKMMRDRTVWSSNGFDIVRIRYDDPVSYRNKVKEVNLVVNRDLGFAENSADKKVTTFLCVTNGRVVALCASESIATGYAMVGPGRRSKVKQRASLGVLKVWTHTNWRRKGLASRLVDLAREKTVYGINVPSTAVAFSSPTVDGGIFAMKYSKMEHPLVYDS